MIINSHSKLVHTVSLITKLALMGNHEAKQSKRRDEEDAGGIAVLH